MAPLTLAPFPPADFPQWVATVVARRASGLMLPLTGDADAAVHDSRALVERTMPDGPDSAQRPLLGVYDGDRRVGWVWLARNEADELGVSDAVLADGVDPLALEAAVAAYLPAGQTHLLINPCRGSDVLHAWVAAGGYEDAATTMVLDLSGPPSPTSVVLVPASPERFERWRSTAIQEYADEIHASTTMSAEAALRKSEEDYARLLPDGLATEDHHFLDVLHDVESVGFLWIGAERGGAFVYDIVLDEARRGQGLGRATMDAGADWCRGRGFPTLGLTVWAHNTVARSLYDSLGYEVVQRFLKKPLS